MTSLVRKEIQETYRVAHLIYSPKLQTHKSLGMCFPEGFWLRQLHNFKQRWENFWTARKLYFSIILNSQMNCQNKDKKCTLQNNICLIYLGLERKKTFFFNTIQYYSRLTCRQIFCFPNLWLLWFFNFFLTEMKSGSVKLLILKLI